MSVQRVRMTPAEIVSAWSSDQVRSIASNRGVMAVAEPVAQYLYGLILETRPQSVLEFGAGWSSAVIASALNRLGGRRRLTSLETTRDYCEEPWSLVEQFDQVDAALSLHTLKPRLGVEGLSYVYDALQPVLVARGPFDFVFIDAPQASYGRYGTLVSVASHLAPGAWVLLDDARRRDEIEAVDGWRKVLGVDLVIHDTAFGRGVALLRVAAPVTPQFAVGPFLSSVATVSRQYVARRWQRRSA